METTRQLSKEDVYALINQHYRANAKRLIKALAGTSGSRHNSEDVVQNAYYRACEYWKSFNILEAPFEKWFNAILNNSIRDKINEERLHGMTDDDGYEEGEVRAINKRILSEVKEYINIQPDTLKNIYILHFINSYQIADIAKIVPKNYKNIERILIAFRKQLKEKFQIGSIKKIYQ